MNIADNLKLELLKSFSTEKSILNSVKNYEIYKFNSLTHPQILKLFDINTIEIFPETNSKKNVAKINELIKNEFYSDKTENYYNIFFTPTNEIKIYNKRKEIIKNLLNTNFEIKDEKKLKEIIKSTNQIKTKISFPKTIYTFEESTAKLLYENYKLNVFTISKKELESMINSENIDIIIVTDENLYIEIPTYTLKDFQKIITGIIIKNNKEQIINFIEFLDLIKDNLDQINQTINSVCNLEYEFNFNTEKLKELLTEDFELEIKELTNKAIRLEEEISEINKELKEIISKKQLSLGGDELLELINSGNITALQNKLKEDTKKIIVDKEKELIEMFKSKGIKIDFIFENHTYPLTIEEEIKNELIKKIDQKSAEYEMNLYNKLGEFNYKEIKNLWNYIYFYDLFFGIFKFIKKYNLEYPIISDKLLLLNGKNIYINNATPINYGLGIENLSNTKLNNEKISVLTGANSGGKTTLLEMFLQAGILNQIGFPINANNKSQICFFDEIIYLKKFTGTQGSGAFEQTIRNLIEILDKENSKLILIDEFEAITEPGAAAKILIEFLYELSQGNNYCISVSHLGLEIKKFIEQRNISEIRIDGISAEGLDEKGNLITNHQPQFYQLGKSTPELILKRILNDEKFWKGKTQKSKNILEKISK